MIVMFLSQVKASLKNFGAFGVKPAKIKWISVVSSMFCTTYLCITYSLSEVYFCYKDCICNNFIMTMYQVQLLKLR